MTNKEAWHKGYIDGYKGLNPRPDYPLVGLAGSYRLGYEAGAKRRKEPKGPRRNGKKSRRFNPTIAGLKGELARVDEDIADLEGDPFYGETPRRRVYRAKWLAYHRRQRRQLEALLKGLEKAAQRRNNGIVEAAAGLQALEYIGAKAKRGGLGRKPRYNPMKKTARVKTKNPKGFRHKDYEQLVKEYGAKKAQRAFHYWIAQPFNFRASVKALPFLRANEFLWNDPKYNKRVDNPRAKGSRDAFGVWHAENPARITIKPYEYRGSSGFKISGTDVRGKHPSIFVRRRETAEAIKRVLKTLGKSFDASTEIDRLIRAERQNNPSVTDLSRTFQGEADGSVEQSYAATGAPANLARAGKLVFLKVLCEGKPKTFRLPGAMVAIAPNEKLWITGPGPLFETKARKGEGLDVGEISHICYETAKAHIGDGKTFEYVHEFGEDGGKRPRLIIDHEGMPIIRGGDYRIRAEGIVN